MNVADVVERLVRDAPSFHHIDVGEPQSFGIKPEVLRWIGANVPAGATSLETGSGHTTVVLCALGGHHTAVAPAATEFAAIREYCEKLGVPTEGLHEQIDISQRVLPQLVDGPKLDFVLIDGDHAFPAPFIDWYYTADRIKQGGLLLVDDTQLETGHVLRRFLMEEPEWEHVTDLGKTAVFRRLTAEPVTTKWWGEQPWASRQHAIPGTGLQGALPIVRDRVRLRTRLKGLLNGGG